MRQDPREPATILIAGGGIVGLTLAMAIKKQLNIVPEVYEKTSTFATEAGAGLGMYPNGLRVLRDISPELVKAVRAAGYPYKKRCWERHDGTKIMDAEESILSEKDIELDSIGIRRSALQKALYNFAVFQGIKVNFRKPFQNAVEQEDGLIRVEFGDGTTRLTKVLLGADGALGKCRSIVCGADEPKLEYTGVTCLMGLSTTPFEGIHFPSSDKDDFHAVFFPTAENESCFQFHVPVPEDSANPLNWGNLSNRVGQEECRKIAEQLKAEGWHPKYIEPLENVIQAVRVGFALLEPKLKTWVKGRIALVGDAAHPPVPYIGQGAQQGMEDAGVLVSMLKIHCLDKNGQLDSTNFEKAMQLYQEIRVPRSSQILNFSKSLGGMQSSRAHKGDQASMADNVLKGEVLMYGTLPIMMPGAGHDYKEDVRRATEKVNLPIVTADATLEAMEYLFGFDARPEPKDSDSATASITSAESDATPPPRPVADPAYEAYDVSSIYSLSPDRIETLIDWLVEGMKDHLKRIVAHNVERNTRKRLDESKLATLFNSSCIVDQVKEIVEVPKARRDEVLFEQDPQWVVLPSEVVSQLREFVTCVSKMYRDNPFHNFEHACSVTVSVSKFLARMSKENGMTISYDDRTYGITSDPLTQFACVMAALLHDTDHEGVPNAQLSKEHPEMSEVYKNRAIAEQHSIEIAWKLFMEPRFKELRSTIYTTEEDMNRFHQLIVNIVMATDICDKELREFRNKRWEKVFSENESHAADEDSPEMWNLKATIGIEHLIQASDISHTMQPWHVYRQWNERLFAEMFKAYKEGRSEKDPTEFWYKGEIGFFDFYVIPLAKKLQQCRVFGSASDECLQFAQRNRDEWVKKGADAVQDMIDNIILGMIDKVMLDSDDF